MEGISLGSAFLRLYGDRSALDRELAVLKRYTDQLEQKGISVKFDADTGKARREVDQLQRGLSGLNDVLRQAGQGLQGGNWDGLAKTLGGIAGQAGGAGGAMGQLGGALGGAVGMASKALPVLGQLGLAAQGLQAIFTGVSAAVNSVLGPLQALSQEAGRFNQQVAEASIFAAQSFAILGPDGQAIEGTAAQMRAVRGVITKEYKEIQKEVANISGATASQIVEGFNLILQNSSALGKRGEDLSFMRKLSTRLAAGMNVLGIPNEQLRSEVSSLLTGDIQMYDQLPKKLGYDRSSVERLKAEGKFADDLMQKLEKLYQGQEVLSASLANVRSNFAEVFQAISAEGGQALERGLAGGLSAVQENLKNLQGSFAGLMRSVSEALEPALVALGEVGGWFTSALSWLASIGQMMGDIAAVATNLIGVVALPGLKAIGGVLQVIGKVLELSAAGVSMLLRPLTVFLRLITRESNASATSFFEDIIKFFDDLITKANAAAAWVARPFVEMAKGIAYVRGKGRGLSDDDIAARQALIEADFASAVGGGATADLRSIQLDDKNRKTLEEIKNRYASGERLTKEKGLSQLVQDRVKNEIQGLEQSLKLMQAQKGVQEAMNGLAESRRGLESSRANFAIQLAASPEARLAAEERRNDLTQRQEQERISERRALLGTEREMLQTQLKIQLRQQQLQQEQLKIQRLEIQIQRDKAAALVQDMRKRALNLPANSPEFRRYIQELQVAGGEVRLRNQQLQILGRTIQLGGEMTSIIQRTNTLEGDRLNIQEQQLGVQGQIVGLNRAQQAQLEQLERQEQAITAERDRNIQTLQEFIALREDDIRRLESEEKTSERLQKLAESRLELQKAQAAAAVQAAEAELKVAQAQKQASESPTSVQAVIGAQIEALAAGTQGLVSEAEATRRLFDAKQRQLELEQEQAREQQRIQQERERSELQIYQLNLKRLVLEQLVQQERLQAEVTLGRLREQRDALSASVMQSPAAGYPEAPTLPAPVGGAVQGGIANMLPGTRGGPNINEGVGWSAWRGRHHNGQDLGLDVGDPIHARRAGVVRQAYSSGFGKVGGAVVIRYDDGSQGTYGHTLPSVRVGQPIAAGQRIATVAPDGQNTHLHYELRDAFGKLLNPLEAIKASLRVPGGQVMGGNAAPGQQAAVSPAAAPSLQNAITDATRSIERSRTLQEELTAQLRESNSTTMPNLLTQQANARNSLTATQQMQQDALRLERTRAQLTAEVLNTPRGRLAGQLTEATAGTLGNTLRGVMTQLFGGEGFDLAGLTESITRTMAERFSGALLEAALAPIEQALTQNLFRMFSGVDVEERARALEQEQAAASLTSAGATLQQAGTTLSQAASSLAGGGAAPGAFGTPYAITQVPFRESEEAMTGVPSFDRIWGATGGPALVPLAESAAGLSQSMDNAGQVIDVVATSAARTAGGFEGLMQNLGRVGAVLGGVAMAAGGVQQVRKGGTYNTLMGLAGIFGSIGSIAGLFGGGGSTSAARLGFGVSAKNLPLAGLGGFRAMGGPVSSNLAYLVGEQGPELIVPTANGTVIPNAQTRALLASRGALGGAGSTSAGGGSGAAFAATQQALATQQMAATTRSVERTIATAAAAPGQPIRFESTVINGMEFVTREQATEIGRQAEQRGAQRGQALVLAALKNSVKTRRSVGL